MVVIVWQLDLKLPMLITAKVVSSNPTRQGVLYATLCDKMSQLLAVGRWGSPVSSTNKVDLHDCFTFKTYNVINYT